MTAKDDTSKNYTASGGKPLALLFSPDLMFGVRIQSISRAAGYATQFYRPGSVIEQAAVMVVNLAGTEGWDEAIGAAVRADVPVIAFGPHMDTESRRRAKQAGATRVLINSNLARDLPGILAELSTQSQQEKTT